MGVSELSRRSGLAKSTTARLAAELTEHGFLERTNGSDLKLGTKLFELGELASRQRKLREVALPYMADLRQVSRQTVHLAVLVDTEVMYVEIVRSRDAPRMPSEVGGRLPAHSAAVGKALLAFSPDAGGAGGHRWRTATGRTPDDHLTRAAAARTAPHQGGRDRLRARGIRARRRLRGQPHLRPDGQPVAAMSISGWNGKLDLRRIGPAVKTAALALTRELQARGPAGG